MCKDLFYLPPFSMFRKAGSFLAFDNLLCTRVLFVDGFCFWLLSYPSLNICEKLAFCSLQTNCLDYVALAVPKGPYSFKCTLPSVRECYQLFGSKSGICSVHLQVEPAITSADSSLGFQNREQILPQSCHRVGS